MSKIVRVDNNLIKSSMKLLKITFLFLIVSSATIAQDLLSPSFMFSHKKIAYITLLDGTEIQGNIKDIDRKKGLIEYIKIKDGSGKKHKLDADQVKHAYLPPSGFDKLVKADKFLNDVRKWTDEKLNQDFFSKGYIYFELADVKIKKKNRKLLMQLLNPDFSKEVKIYHDPFAKETMSIGIGPAKIGGISKSYYVAKGENAAYRLKKKDYAANFKPLWQSCESMMTKYERPKWSELVKHAISFSECSE